MNHKAKTVADLKSAYSNRSLPNINHYSWFKPDVCLYRHERDRVMLRLLRKAGIQDLSNLNIFEIGCGFGDNLLNLIKMGALPERIYGSDIIKSRIDIAKSRLPESVNLYHEDSSESLNTDTFTCYFDLIIQFTVFSSVLSNGMQIKLANNLMQMLKKDGCILWYDFIYNNPRNTNVRGCSKSRIQELFPNTNMIFKKVTLAPPLCRALVRHVPILYSVLGFFPIFKTHLFTLIRKI